LGLAGSLVLGLLELFAGHGQNRFTRELEEWLSSITRIGIGSDEGSGEAGALGLVIDHMAGQMEQLQMLYSQSEISRSQTDGRIGELASALVRLTELFESEKGQAATLKRIAEGQERMIAILGAAETGGQGDGESRMRLRSIDVQLLRILEEMSAGRQETVADLKSDLAAMSAAIRQLGRSTTGRS